MNTFDFIYRTNLNAVDVPTISMKLFTQRLKLLANHCKRKRR
jgi:hypothetical protein